MVCRLNQLLKKEVLQESLVGFFSHQGFFFRLTEMMNCSCN